MNDELFKRLERNRFKAGNDPHEVLGDHHQGIGSVSPAGFVSEMMRDGTGRLANDGNGIIVEDGTGAERVRMGHLGGNDYGLRINSPDGTVIIDGSSNVFKIVASGTLTTASFTQPNEATNTAVITTNFGTLYDPSNLCHVLVSSGARASNYIVPSTLATDPNPTGILDYYEVWVEGTSTTQSTVRVRTRSWRNGGTQVLRTYRYNIFREIAF